MKKRNICIAFGYIMVYLAVYLTGRIIWCNFGDGNLIDWLFTVSPTGEHSYLYGWLLSSHLFWYALAISVIPSLWGKFKFSAVTTAGFIVGIVAGMIFGPYPAGTAIGHDHYGWAIWIGIYLISIVIGIIVEKYKRKTKSVI